MRKEMPEIYVTCLRVHSWVKAPAEGTLGSLCTAHHVESANPFLETQEYWHQSKSCLTSGVIFCKHLLIGFANLRPLWSFLLISLVQCISSSIKIIVFPPWHTNTLSWPHLLTPLSTEAIKLSASPVTRARRTALILCLPCGDICGCPTDWLSLEINEPDRGLGAESASLMGLGSLSEWRLPPSYHLFFCQCLWSRRQWMTSSQHPPAVLKQDGAGVVHSWVTLLQNYSPLQKFTLG